MLAPVVFLNPAVVLDWPEPVVAAGEVVHGTRRVPPWPNGSVDRLNELCRALAAGIVCTRLRSFGDPRAELTKLGLRASFLPLWSTDPLLDRRDGIAAYLELHGSPPSVVIDRPDIVGVGDARISVALGAEIMREACEAATATIAAL